jgi:hypothetical protein
VSTAKRTPIPKGQPSWFKVERVPTEANSTIVLETSAGNGLFCLTSKWVGSDTTEREHFVVRNRDWRNGFGIGGVNWVLDMGLEGVSDRAKRVVRD